MDFQDLLRGADCHQNLKYRHGSVRCGAECGQPVGGGHHLRVRYDDLACRLERGSLAGAVIPERVRGAVYADSFHLHISGDLRQNDRGVSGDLYRAHPLCHNGQPGVGLHGAELPSLSAGLGLPGLTHYDLRGHLREGICTSGDNISAAIWGCMGYTVLLCYTLFKTGSLAKSLFGAL